MGKKETDYEKMKEEYDRVHPLKLCAEPFLSEESGISVECLYKCYESYLEVSLIIKGIQRALPQSLNYIALSIINLSDNICEIAFTTYKNNGGEREKESKNTDKLGYTQSIRRALILSGEVITYLFEKPALQSHLPLSNMQVVHSLLLTLTAF